MRFRPASLGWLAVLFLTAACHRPEPSRPAAAAAPQPASLTAVDPGASLLAEVENARAALAAKDEVAAMNDVNQALSFAVTLPDASSDVYPTQLLTSDDSGAGGGAGGSGGGGSGGGHRHGHGGGGGHHGQAGAPPAQPQAQAASPPPAAAPPAGRHAHKAGGPPQAGAAAPAHVQTAAFTAFDAQVKLTSAQAELDAHDLRGADADLAAIQAGAAAGAVPATLPLLRAEESLALAKTALASADPNELKTQLANAAEALGAYNGAAHAAEVRTLAATINALLSRPGGLASLEPDLVSSWSDRIDGWG